MKDLKALMNRPDLDNRPRKVTGHGHVQTHTPKEGHYWNPLKEYPDAYPCFCGKGVLAINCCKPKLAAAVPKEWAEWFLNRWDGILKGKVRVTKSTKGQIFQ